MKDYIVLFLCLAVLFLRDHPIQPPRHLHSGPPPPAHPYFYNPYANVHVHHPSVASPAPEGPVEPLGTNTARVKFPAPYFKTPAVVNKNFQDISLEDYPGKWIVLFFYPLDFTFVCPTEIIEFSDRKDEFAALNAQVLGASVDSKYSHLAWINTPRKEGGLGSISIPLLSDITKRIANAYGVLAEDGTALRGTFLIDPKRILRQITINDMSVGRNIDETLRLLEAFQYADTNGEVCPAGWKKGAKTMFDDPLRSKEYFNSKFE